MKDTWEDLALCATKCASCDSALGPTDKRILSVYNHQPICMACKEKEEARPDYADASKEMIGRCMADSETMYGDPGGFCYHHFYPFKC